MSRLLPPLFAASLLLAPTVRASEIGEGEAFFENHIRPVLVESCYACHSQESATSEGELTLDNRAGVARGGRGGAVVVPGDPDKSRLIQALEHHDAALAMPPDGRLPDDVIQAFRHWVAIGAPDPRDGAPAQIETIAGRAAEHWAYRKPTRPNPPSDPTSWSRTDADRLVAAKLRAAGLRPSAPADPGVLIRRLYFDLTGLAPTRDQVLGFERDASPDAYERLVDRLLASPQFGERWARHWLDVARFADTKGYAFTEGREFPNAYKYRDWVIHSLNDDLPIDQFLRRQVAADLLPDAAEGDQAALGYVTLGRRFINNRHDIIADRLDVVFRGMMGVSITCARCHDHKYDPISIDDYYALYGVLQSSQEVQDEALPLRLADKPQAEDVGVFIRGSAHNRGAIVPRGAPAMFAGFAKPVTAGSGRKELADAIVHPDNPLTARVFVNRVWGRLFGEQLVTTPSDFGLRCDPPAQQDLLDLLTVDFTSDGWSLKSLVRGLVTSSVYRQASTADESLLALDPENELWGRANRRRLDFESLRDRLLAVAGRLDAQVGGPSEDITAHATGSRRTLYAQIDRQNLPAVFRTFDFASPDAHSPERAHTLAPQQSLFLLNGELTEQVAAALSALGPADSDDDRIAALYRSVLAREPTPAERDLAHAFLAQSTPQPLPPDEWSFGLGKVDAGRVVFEPLTHFADNRWQPRPAFPDNQFGHVSVSPAGGHPGRSREVSSIRRWTAPRAGRLSIEGSLQRPEQQGDGVQGLVVSSRRGVLGEWVVEHGAAPTPVRVDAVEPGEHVDFVVSCRENDGYDTYLWQASLTLETPAARQTWNTEQGFHGPAADPADLWTQLGQVLLMSNEFLYVD